MTTYSDRHKHTFRVCEVRRVSARHVSVTVHGVDSKMHQSTPLCSGVGGYSAAPAALSAADWRVAERAAFEVAADRALRGAAQ